MHRIVLLSSADRIVSGMKNAVRRLMRRYDLSASSHAFPLEVQTDPGRPIELSMTVPTVLDGLETLASMGRRNPAKHHTADLGEDFPRVLRAYMIVTTGRVAGVPLKISVSAHVTEPDLIRGPAVRAPVISIIQKETEVHTVTTLPQRVGVSDASARARLPEPLVRDRTSKVAGHPLIRASVDLERVESEERESFLREAESIKGIPYGQGKLLALFRNVPVEIVAKAHYAEEKKVLLYSLETPSGTTRTRVHDLGIVRDDAAGKNHMIVHRRQFKTVPIS